jgi:hypothetical protein
MHFECILPTVESHIDELGNDDEMEVRVVCMNAWYVVRSGLYNVPYRNSMSAIQPCNNRH